MVVSSTLPRAWVERIFSRLAAIYGKQFTEKFHNAEEAMDVWAEELGGFLDNPDAIGYAMKYLDPKFAPSALEFRDICRRAPKKEVHALPAPAMDEAKYKAAVSSAKAAASGNKDWHDWAKRPRSRLAYQAVCDLAKTDRYFQEYLDNLVADGHVVNGVLVRRWTGNQWERI